MRWWLPVFLWAVAVGGGLAPVEAAAADGVVDRIVAVVNEDIITLYDIEMLLRPMAQNVKSQGLPAERERQTLGKLREEMLDNLINTKLTEQEVKRYKIAVTDEEVENHIRQVKQRRSLSDENLKAGLAQEGLNLEEYRKEVKLQIQRSKLVNREVRSKVVITQADIKDYYEKNKSKYGSGKQYYLWNLFVKLPPPPDPGGPTGGESTAAGGAGGGEPGPYPSRRWCVAPPMAPRASRGRSSACFVSRSSPLSCGMRSRA